ncbi:hypothetical protein ACOMHN_064578 [Nucella lapillus]
MARLLSACLVLVLLSAILLQCEARKRKRLPAIIKECCYRGGCYARVRGRGLKCCDRRQYCLKIKGRRGVCRPRKECRPARDAEEAEEDIDVPDTRELEEDNAPHDFMNPYSP